MSKAHPPELKKLMDKRLTLKLNANRQVIQVVLNTTIVFVFVFVFVLVVGN